VNSRVVPGSADVVDWDLVRSAEELIPLLSESAEEAERLNRLPAVTIKALESAGMTRLTMPARLGGEQANLPTQFEVTRSLARGCGSASWVASLYAVCGYWASLFPDSVQDEVFTGPESRVAGISTPAGSLVPVDGGYTLNGQWAWNTGVLDATWNVVATLRATDDGGMMPYLALVPVSELTLLDDWHMSGMKGTGSVTSIARDVFVPAARTLPFPPLLGGEHASEANRHAVEYSYAVYPFLLTASIGTFMGMAQGALESFAERAASRATSFEDRTSQADSPVARLQTGEIAIMIESALALSRQVIASLHQHAAAGTPVPMEERVRVRAAVAYAIRQSTDAVAALARIGGATAFRLDLPVQRHLRDSLMLANHAVLNYEANVSVLGTLTLGSAPQTIFL
jgi:3-hydroxy-9,10-secoandrosta-1,3,5(10)-triene-9,17-dione monooxygenase